MNGGSPWRCNTGATMRRRRLECWNIGRSTIPLFLLPHRLRRPNLCGDQKSPHACGGIPVAPLCHGGGLSGPSVHCCGGIPGAYERRPQVPPTASHRMSPLRSPAATTESPALQPRPLGLPGSRAPPHPLPPLRGPQPPPPRAARGPSRTPPRQPPQLTRVPHRHPPGPPGRVLRGGCGGPRMDHSRGHGQHTPAPPQPTPTPQRRRLERGVPPHPLRPIPSPPRPTPPRPTTPGPPSSSPDAGSVGRHGTRGDSSLPPNHLPPVQQRPRPTEGNTLPTQRTPLPGTPPPPRTTEAPGGLGVFSGRPPGRPRRGHATRMGLTDQETYVRGLKTSLQEAHSWHARCPSPPRGQGGSTAPDTHQAKKTKTGQGACQRARQQGATPRPRPGSSHTAPPHAQTPGAHQVHRHRQRPPPPPYRSTQTLQPSQPPPPTHVHTMPGPPYAQSQGTWHHQHDHHAPVPPNPYPLMPPCYSDPHQLHPHHAPAQPGPANHPPDIAHITAPHHHVFHHHQPLPPHPPTPGYHTQPAHPPHHHHAVQHHPPPPLHGPTTYEPRYTPMDPRGTAHARQ